MGTEAVFVTLAVLFVLYVLAAIFIASSGIKVGVCLALFINMAFGAYALTVAYQVSLPRFATIVCCIAIVCILLLVLVGKR